MTEATDPVRRQLSLLLSGYGYNLYDQKNRARADDLLVRQKAADYVSAATTALRDLRTEYRRRFLPPPTRDNPSPPPERLASLAEIAALQEQAAALETRLRSVGVPVQDRTWERFRSERVTLNRLLLLDYNLIAPCQELRTLAEAIDPDSWSNGATQFRDLVGQITASLRARQDFLTLPG